MALQSNHLIMSGLGILKDVPVNNAQPPLQRGVHLRWKFKQDLGFPWHGYHLFRRETLKEKYQSFTDFAIKLGTAQYTDLLPGVESNLLDTEHGFIVSNEFLQLGENFLPGTDVEIEMKNNSYLAFLFQPSPAHSVRVTLGFLSEESTKIKVQLWNKTMKEVTLNGAAGSTSQFEFKFDAITSLEFPKGEYSIVDIEYRLVFPNAYKDWKKISTFTYPLAMPVSHPDYPCVTAPMTEPNAEGLAMNRIQYGPPGPWSGGNFSEFHDVLEQLVKGGPSGPSMDSKSLNVLEDNELASPTPTSLHMPEQKPLDMVLLGAINPAVAQMVGLYFNDETAKDNEQYDYFVIADHDGSFYKRYIQYNKETGGNNNEGVNLEQLDFVDDQITFDGWITYRHQLIKQDPVEKVSDIKVYGLVGGTKRDEETGLIKNENGTNSAGLTWDLKWTDERILLPGNPILYDLYRYNYGEKEPDNSVDLNQFKKVSKFPFAVVNIDESLENEMETSSQFPPFRLHAYDNSLEDGWYGYNLTSIDIFGRFSDYSDPAIWHQWKPAPDPLPWYYDEASVDNIIHDFAVRLLDTTPPPPPLSVEAWALDPLDPYVLKDTSYASWHSELILAGWHSALSEDDQNDLLGLRVHWKWSQYQMRQSPRAAAFRILFNAGSTLPADNGDSSNWNDTLIEVPIDEFDYASVKVMFDEGSNELEGINTGSHAGTTVSLPGGTDLSKVRPGVEHIQLQDAAGNNEVFLISAVNDAANTVTIPSSPIDVDTTCSWTIGLLEWNYRLFLPNVDGDLSSGLQNMDTTNASPIAYANIAIYTVDDKSPINKGPVSGASKIARVHRALPDAPPALPPDSDKVYASKADYYGKSFYTYRWTPATGLKTVIHRSLDETIFNVDYKWRSAGSYSLDPENNSTHMGYFPNEVAEPDWDSLKRTTITSEINALNDAVDDLTRAEAFEEYRKLSNDALRVIAGLPDNDQAYTQLTVLPLDHNDAKWTNELGPDNDSNFAIDSALKKFIDTLPGKAKNRYFYRSSYIDSAQNRGKMGPATVPIYLPDVFPAKAPVISKICGEELGATLKWPASRLSSVVNYEIYRTDISENTRDIRLMGDPIAIVPASPLKLIGGSISIDNNLDIEEVIAVYSNDEFLPNNDWLTEQTAENFHSRSTELNDESISGFEQDDLDVVVIYSDSKGITQSTPCRSIPRTWQDGNLTFGKYFYMLTITRQIELPSGGSSVIVSPTSKAKAVQPYNKISPPPPQYTSLDWILVNESTGENVSWPLDNIIPPGHLPAINIVWETEVKSPSFKITKKKRDDRLWRPEISESQIEAISESTFQMTDLDVDPQEVYSYRIKVISSYGTPSLKYHEIDLPTPTIA